MAVLRHLTLAGKRTTVLSIDLMKYFNGRSQARGWYGSTVISTSGEKRERGRMQNDVDYSQRTRKTKTRGGGSEATSRLQDFYTINVEYICWTWPIAFKCSYGIFEFESDLRQ